MPLKCAVLTCYNGYTNRTVMLHGFPKESEMINLWLKACGRPDSYNAKTGRVCSVHFRDTDYVRDLQAELLGYEPVKRLKECAVPSIDCFATEEYVSDLNSGSEEVETVAHEKGHKHQNITTDTCTDSDDYSISRNRSKNIRRLKSQNCHHHPPTKDSRDASTNTEFVYQCPNCERMNEELIHCKDALKPLLKFRRTSDFSLRILEKSLHALKVEKRSLQRELFYARRKLLASSN